MHRRTSSGQPLGVTLRTTNGAANCLLPVGSSCWWGYEWAPDLDAYLVNPSGTVVSMSRCMLEATNGNCAAPGRFETVGVASAAAGMWQLRVESFSGAGSFQADVFGAVGSAEPSAPSAPSGLTATATSSSAISLAWSDTSTDETGFEVQRCMGASCGDLNFSTVATVGADATAYSDSGLSASTSYGYRVRARNGTLSSAWTTPDYAITTAAPTPPAAPTGLTATATSSSAITLAWSDNSTDETGFAVERCSGSGCSGFTQVATVSAGVTAFSDAGLTASTSYSYRVRAFNAAGSSGHSNTAGATTEPTTETVPSAPAGLTATATSSTTVVLTWSDDSTNETYFRIERCKGTKCTPSYLTTVEAGTTSYQDTGLARSTSYRYRVQACNAAGCSAYSSTVTVKTPR